MTSVDQQLFSEEDVDLPTLDCGTCHQSFGHKRNLTRHKDKNRCMFAQPSTASDICLIFSTQNVAEVMEATSSYKKLEMAKLLETCVKDIYPMIFTGRGAGVADVPAVRDVVAVHGSVNNYKLLAAMIDESHTGQVALPKRVKMPCTLCQGELVLSGLTKPRMLSYFDVDEDRDNWLVSKKHRKNGNKKFSSDNLPTDPAVGNKQQEQSASDYSVWSSMNIILGLI